MKIHTCLRSMNFCVLFHANCFEKLIFTRLGLAFGNHVTVISSTESKRQEAIASLGATRFINSSNGAEMAAAAMSLDFIIDTASAEKDMDSYLSLLDFDGKLVTVGLLPPETNLKVNCQLF